MKLSTDKEKEKNTMTNNEFLAQLNEAVSRHPIIAKSKAKTVNELLYVLRMEFSNDFNVSIKEKDGTWGCIPSTKECFIPVKTLALKIKSIKYEEEVVDFDDRTEVFHCLTIETK